MHRTKAKYLLLLLFVALQTNLRAGGQTTQFPINEWAKKLNSKDDVENSFLRKISWDTLKNYDSATVADCIKQLENTGESGAYFKARITFLKAADVYYRGGNITTLIKLCEQSLYEAYETGDNYFIAYMSFFLWPGNGVKKRVNTKHFLLS
jgi:hypothetical protein